MLAFNPDQRTVEPFISGLTLVTDVLWHARPDGTSRFYVLEFSTNQSATLAPPVRLLRFDGPNPPGAGQRSAHSHVFGV